MPDTPTKTLLELLICSQLIVKTTHQHLIEMLMLPNTMRPFYIIIVAFSFSLLITPTYNKLTA